MRKWTAPPSAAIGGATGWGRGSGGKFEMDRLKSAKALKTMLFFFKAVTLCQLPSVSDAIQKHSGLDGAHPVATY